jgi:hypothetical protein
MPYASDISQASRNYISKPGDRYPWSTAMTRRTSRAPKTHSTAKRRKRKQLANKIRKTLSIKKVPPNPRDLREQALGLMKKGASQAAAAKSVGITAQRLARYRRASTNSKRKGLKWIIKDNRPAEMYLAENGRVSQIAVPHRTKSAVGHYWNDVNEFLVDNNPAHLQRYVGHSIRDIKGKKHVYETDPNTLRMLDAMGELNFITVYVNTAQ